jgi:hypothetical protein
MPNKAGIIQIQIRGEVDLKSATVHTPNDFALNPQPSAYFELVLGCLRQICQVFLLFDIWSKFGIFVYCA